MSISTIGVGVRRAVRGCTGCGCLLNELSKLRRLADARGVEPSVLARQWVIAQLDAAERQRDVAQEHWERDLRATADHLRQLLDERPGA
jgi:hypothetical protein